MDIIKKLENYKYEYLLGKIGKCHVSNNYLCCEIDINKLKKYSTYYKIDTINNCVNVNLDGLTKDFNKNTVFIFRNIDFKSMNVNIISEDENALYSFLDCVFRKDINIDTYDIKMSNNHYKGFESSKTINIGGHNTSSISITKQNIIDYDNNVILFSISTNHGNVYISDSNINVKDLTINNAGKSDQVNINYSNITASRVIINSSSLDVDNSLVLTKTFVNNGNKSVSYDYGILTVYKRNSSSDKYGCKIKVKSQGKING